MFLLSWQQLSVTMEHYQLDIYLKTAILSYQKCLEFYSVSIDIKRKNRLLKVYYVPATSTTFLAFFLFFLLWPLTVLMKQTRQAVRLVKQSIFLRCL
jgi:hypothetical protein